MMILFLTYTPQDPKYPWANLFQGDERLQLRSDTDGKLVLLVHSFSWGSQEGGEDTTHFINSLSPFLLSFTFRAIDYTFSF